MSVLFLVTLFHTFQSLLVCESVRQMFSVISLIGGMVEGWS